MTVLATTVTTPAFPLGIPVDGRPRFGMTPVQAVLYRACIEQFDTEGRINFRRLSRALALSPNAIFIEVQSLVERGWLQQVPARPNGEYFLVEPVMRFPKVPVADVAARRSASKAWGRKRGLRP